MRRENMNYIVDVQKAIDYIEENLEEDIHYTNIAQYIGMSPFYFHRMFGAIVGISPAEYIRNRRLTCAADELTRKNTGILDIAIKYQFGSNESFTRAFTKFHGISPRVAKKEGTKLKSFSKINLKLTIEGGSTMNYRIETKKAFMILAVVREFNLQTSRQKIPKFWEELKQNGMVKELSSNYTKKTMGICFGEYGTEDFKYGIGIEVENKDKALRKRMVVIVLRK